MCDTNILVSDTSSEGEFSPPEVVEKANEVINRTLPQKSKPKYEKAYIKFMEWRSSKQINNLSETVLLAYFNELSETHKPSSLWATYSMLRCMIQIKHELNIINYSYLVSYLKQKNKGYKSKKAEILSAEQINQFLREAPDNKFLAIKVALIFGVQGACRRHELCNITVNDIEDKNDMVLINIPKTKNEKSRSFVVTDDFYHIYKKYANLRPKNVITKRFFLNYRNGLCSQKVIGINNFGSMPKKVATFLKLKNPESYTGHTFRRTFTTLLADSGADLLSLKKHGTWKTSNTAEGCMEESVGNALMSQQISNAIFEKPISSEIPLTSIEKQLRTYTRTPDQAKYSKFNFSTTEIPSTSISDTIYASNEFLPTSNEFLRSRLQGNEIVLNSREHEIQLRNKGKCFEDMQTEIEELKLRLSEYEIESKINQNKIMQLKKHNNNLIYKNNKIKLILNKVSKKREHLKNVNIKLKKLRTLLKDMNFYNTCQQIETKINKN